MDDYEWQQALEAMAGAAAVPADTTESIGDAAARWAKLFQLSQDGAVDRIIQHRNDLARSRVTDEYWSVVQAEKEAQGYNREAFEYELNLEKQRAAVGKLLSLQDDAASTVTYLVELKGPLSDVETIRTITGTANLPAVASGHSGETWEDVQLACIDAQARSRILLWSAAEGRGYEPTILVNPESMR